MNPFHDLHEPQRLNLLICFVDIENFTSISQAKADPIELFGILSGMATVMSEMIGPTEGRVIKFIGDSALIVFPESAADAGMKLLLELKRAVEEYLKTRGFTSRLKTCVHFGEAAIGPFGGSAGLDVMGDSINVAARLGRGEHRGRFIISPQAFRKLKPETRKVFHKYTPPIVYLADE